MMKKFRNKSIEASYFNINLQHFQLTLDFILIIFFYFIIKQ